VLTASHEATGGPAPYIQASGTSIACAHVAGAAALLLQLHPSFEHDEIKATLMATSRSSDIQTGEHSPFVSVLSQGAGLIDLARAASPAVLFSPPSLSLAFAAPGGHYPLEIAVRDPRDSGAARTFDISVEHSQGMTVTTPSQLSVNAGSEVTLELLIDIAADAAPGDFEAYVYLTSNDVSVHLPIWVHVVSPIEAATVLLIDNDFSFFESYADYAGYVTDALDEIGLSYQVWNADAHFDNPHTIPPLEELQQYKVIIWLTGDNIHPDGYYVPSTPLTLCDMQILSGYLDSGGRILAIGQNLAESSDVNPNTDPTWGRSDFYHSYLGAHWLAGSLFDPNEEGNFPPQAGPGAVGLPDTFLSGVQLHLGGVGDGASNQTSIDEIAPGGVADGSDLDLVQPLLVAVDGQPLANGYVAVAKSDEPILEKESASIPYRSVYYSFGFEGINNTSTTTTRIDFLASTLDWLLDEVSVDLDQGIISSRNELTYISCSAVSSVGAEILSYRWDLGEGQTVTSDEPTIAHCFSSRGQHAIAVEATDSLGHKAVAQSTVTIVKGGSSTLAVSSPSVFRAEELSYTVVARNTDAEAISFSFSLPAFGRMLNWALIRSWLQQSSMPMRIALAGSYIRASGLRYTCPLSLNRERISTRKGDVEHGVSQSRELWRQSLCSGLGDRSVWAPR